MTFHMNAVILIRIWGRTGVEVQPPLEIYPAIDKNMGRKGQRGSRDEKGKSFLKMQTPVK
jgi:hypothetical protein